jgi:alanyl-tRNA synthetase
MGQDDGIYSVELCGGTHVRRTGDIGLFKIVGETAVAAGVRRIEALTAEAAFDHLTGEEALLAETAATVRTSPAELPGRVAALVEDKKRLERELIEARKKLATANVGGDSAAGPVAKTIAGVNFATRRVSGVPAGELKGMVDALKKELGSGVVALAATDNGKASLLVGVTEDLVGRISAVDLVRIGAEALGGKGGGGRPDLAQAGGPDNGRADDALAAIEQALAAKAAA